MAREPMLVLDVLRHLICHAVSFALGEVLAVGFSPIIAKVLLGSSGLIDCFDDGSP